MPRIAARECAVTVVTHQRAWSPAGAGTAVPNRTELGAGSAAVLLGTALRLCAAEVPEPLMGLSDGGVTPGRCPLLLAWRYPVGQCREEVDRLYTARKDGQESEKVFAEECCVLSFPT